MRSWIQIDLTEEQESTLKKMWANSGETEQRHLLQMAGEVWRHGRINIGAYERAGEGKRPVQGMYVDAQLCAEGA